MKRKGAFIWWRSISPPSAQVSWLPSQSLRSYSPACIAAIGKAANNSFPLLSRPWTSWPITTPTPRRCRSTMALDYRRRLISGYRRRLTSGYHRLLALGPHRCPSCPTPSTTRPMGRPSNSRDLCIAFSSSASRSWALCIFTSEHFCVSFVLQF